MKDNIIPICNILYGRYRYGFAYNVISICGLCFALTTTSGGGREPIITIVYDR